MRGIAVVLSVVLGGCAVSGRIPDPPRDADLANDGSPESRAALLAKYRVQPASPVMANFRPRATIGPASVPESVLSLTHPALRTYLESDPEAAALLHSPLREVLPSAIITPAWVLWALVLPPYLLSGFAIVPTSEGLSQQEIDAAPFGWNQPTAYGVATGVFTLASITLVTLAVGLIGGGLLVLFLEQRSRAARADAINTFNAHLEDRIARNAHPAPPPPPPPPEGHVSLEDQTGCVDAASLDREVAALVPDLKARGTQLSIAVRPSEDGSTRAVTLFVQSRAGSEPTERTLEIPASECIDAPRVLARIAAAQVDAARD